MDIQKISHKATVYTFHSIKDYSTSVFLIEKESKIYIIDTFCGPESMIPILNVVKENMVNKEVTIINTHFHWDHVWGNCSFNKNNIISHELCRKLLDKFWETQISNNIHYVSGRVEKCLPNITFTDKMIFQDDKIELFYSPGHTIDSISIFDHEEKILYVGDNLEKPIVYVESDDIPTYIKTLENYLNYFPKKIVASHTLDLTEEDILSTIKYLKGLLAGEKMCFESEYVKKVHSQNLNTIQKV